MMLLEWLDGEDRKCALALGQDRQGALARKCAWLLAEVLDELTRTGHVVTVYGISEASAQAARDTAARKRGRAWVGRVL